MLKRVSYILGAALAVGVSYGPMAYAGMEDTAEPVTAPAPQQTHLPAPPSFKVNGNGANGHALGHANGHANGHGLNGKSLKQLRAPTELSADKQLAMSLTAVADTIQNEELWGLDYLAQLPSNSAESDAYAQKLIEKLKRIADERGVKLNELKIYIHSFGDVQIRSFTSWIIDSLLHAGVQVGTHDVIRWDREWQDMAPHKLSRIVEQLDGSDILLQCQNNADRHPEIGKWCTPEISSGIASAIGRSFRMLANLPGGLMVTVSPLIDSRTGLKRPVFPYDMTSVSGFLGQASHLRDLGVGMLLASWTVYVTWESLTHKFPNDSSVNIPLAIGVAAAWTLFYKWIDPGVKALMGVAKSYRPDIRSIREKLRWSFPLQFMLSFVATSSMMYALLGSELGADHLQKAALNNANGAFAKIGPNRLCTMLIHMMDRPMNAEDAKASELKLFWVRMGIDVIFEVIKFGSLFDAQWHVPGSEVSVPVSWIYFTLGGMGLAWMWGEHMFARAVRQEKWSVSSFWKAFCKQGKKDLRYAFYTLPRWFFSKKRLRDAIEEASLLNGPAEQEAVDFVDRHTGIFSGLKQTAKALVNVIGTVFGVDQLSDSAQAAHDQFLSWVYADDTAPDRKPYGFRVMVEKCPKALLNSVSVLSKPIPN